MAGWRQVIELAMTDEEIGRLAVIARTRSESASRVERAQMLLGYRQNPSFFAVGQEWPTSPDGATGGIEARAQGTHHGRYRRRQSPSGHPHLVLQARRGRIAVNNTD